MVAYFPILKGREGELTAISNLSELQSRCITPILEVCPSEKGPTRAAYDFIQHVQARAPANLRLGVDVCHLVDPVQGHRRPMRDIAEDLGEWGIPIAPVLHINTSDSRLADLGRAAELNDGHAIVRLGGPDMDPNEEDAESGLTRLLDRSGLTVDQCDLMLDMFEVRSERDVSRTEPVVRKCIAWARKHPWKSISVVAGAMPPSLSDMPTNVATPIIRWDRRLWQRVADAGVCFGDYGIGHPEMRTGGWAPMPNLRYTADDVWWIFRWPTNDRAARATFYDLCESLVSSDHWPAEGRKFSWGDKQLALRADGVGGPGNATNWRAWGTSHHIAQVIHDMAD